MAIHLMECESVEDEHEMSVQWQRLTALLMVALRHGW